jgi:hypothetical protein
MVGGPASGSEAASGTSSAELSQDWRGRAAVATLVSLAVLALGAVAAHTSSGGKAWGSYEDIARTSWTPSCHVTQVSRLRSVERRLRPTARGRTERGVRRVERDRSFSF